MTGVSELALKIIKKAIKIRLDAGEDTLENLVAIYAKLSPEQAAAMLEEFKDYKPISQEESTWIF